MPSAPLDWKRVLAAVIILILVCVCCRCYNQMRIKEFQEEIEELRKEVEEKNGKAKPADQINPDPNSREAKYLANNDPQNFSTSEQKLNRME